MATRTWFITGTSRGFGREWAVAALERGDRVAATARDPKTLHDLTAQYGDALLTTALDVTDRDAVFAAVKQAHDHFGALDVIVSSAGCGQFWLVDAPQPPLRAFLGTAPLGIAEADYASRLASWREWQPVAELAQG